MVWLSILPDLGHWGQLVSNYGQLDILYTRIGHDLLAYTSKLIRRLNLWSRPIKSLDMQVSASLTLHTLHCGPDQQWSSWLSIHYGPDQLVWTKTVQKIWYAFRSMVDSQINNSRFWTIFMLLMTWHQSEKIKAIIVAIL